MKSFIYFNLRNLFTKTFPIIIFIYLSFAWFLNDRNLNPASFDSSSNLTGSYDLVLFSIMFLNYVLLAIQHFEKEIANKRFTILHTRISENQFIGGLFVAYISFFIVGFILPTYLVALLQQSIFSPGNIEYGVFISKSFSIALSLPIIWLTIAIFLFRKYRDSFVVIIIVIILYAVSFVIIYLTNGLVFDYLWLYKMTNYNDSFLRLSMISLFWSFLLFVSLIFLSKISKRISDDGGSSSYKNSFLSKLADRFNLYLAKYHIKMMGRANQKILTLFLLIGLLLIIPAIKNPAANLLVLGKIYIGAFVPLLFSFNQYYIIQIDRDAGMIHNNFLRMTKYSKIILHRWLLLITPQLIIVSIFVSIFSAILFPFQITFYIYIILLCICISLVNLLFAVISKNNNAANLIVFFLVYLQLRDNVRESFFRMPFLKKLNIFEPLLQSDNGTILFIHFLILILILLIILFILKIFLDKVEYVAF